MKIHKIFSGISPFLAAAAAMAMTACSADEEALIQSPVESPADGTVLTIGDVTIDNEGLDTRTLDNTTFSKGDRIGLYILDSDMNPIISNLPVSFDGKGWDCNEPMEVNNYLEGVSLSNLKKVSPELRNNVYRLGYEPVMAVAYYPYTSGFDGRNPFAATNPAEITIDTDFLVSDPLCISPIPGTETKLFLKFRHKFSCLKLNVSWPEGVEPLIADINLYNKSPLLNENGASYFCRTATFATRFSRDSYLAEIANLAAKLHYVVENANSDNLMEMLIYVEHIGGEKYALLEEVTQDLSDNYLIPNSTTRDYGYTIELSPGHTSSQEIYVCPYLPEAEYITARANIALLIEGSIAYDGEYVVDSFEPRWQAGKIYTYNAGFKPYTPM